MLRRSTVVALIAFAAPLFGCPTQAPQKPCARVGDSCAVSPGKLGTCVNRDECVAGGDCFVCQPQH